MKRFQIAVVAGVSALLFGSLAEASAKRASFQLFGGMGAGDADVSRSDAEQVRLPQALARKTVTYTGPLSPGTILVRTMMLFASFDSATVLPASAFVVNE